MGARVKRGGGLQVDDVVGKVRAQLPWPPLASPLDLDKALEAQASFQPPGELIHQYTRTTGLAFLLLSPRSSRDCGSRGEGANLPRLQGAERGRVREAGPELCPLVHRRRLVRGRGRRPLDLLPHLREAPLARRRGAGPLCGLHRRLQLLRLPCTRPPSHRVLCTFFPFVLLGRKLESQANAGPAALPTRRPRRGAAPLPLPGPRPQPQGHRHHRFRLPLLGWP